MKTEKFGWYSHVFWSRSIQMVRLSTFALATLFCMSSHGQQCSGNHEYLQEGDLVLSSGTRNSHCIDVFELTFDVPATDASNWQQPEYPTSWLCPEGACVATPGVNSLGHVTTVTITRNDSVQKSGYGEVARFNSWILVDNADIRQPQPSAETKSWHDHHAHKLHIFTASTESQWKVEVRNMQGKPILKRKLQGGRSIEIDTSNWPVGIYLLSIQSNGEQVLIKKILVQ